MLGSRESGLDLLSNANSLFLLLLVFAQCLVLVVTIMSTQSVGLHCGVYTRSVLDTNRSFF